MTDTANPFGYVDCETTGLDPRLHWAYELAWAIDGGDIRVCHLPHSLEYADPVALRIGGYDDRGFEPHQRRTPLFHEARRQLTGVTLVACNPAFDQEFIRKAFGYQAWHYRLLDLEAWGAGVLGFERPLGNKDLQAELLDRGFTIEGSDHTAAQDVSTLRQCHTALLQIQANERALAGG